MKKTIAQLREQDARSLAQRTASTPEEIETGLKDARRALRAFYRFTALYQREFYTEQSRKATQAEKDEASAKSERAYNHAADLLRPYGLRIDCPGLYPCIDELSGANFTHGHFYH